MARRCLQDVKRVSFLCWLFAFDNNKNVSLLAWRKFRCADLNLTARQNGGLDEWAAAYPSLQAGVRRPLPLDRILSSMVS